VGRAYTTGRQNIAKNRAAAVAAGAAAAAAAAAAARVSLWRGLVWRPSKHRRPHLEPMSRAVQPGSHAATARAWTARAGCSCSRSRDVIGRCSKLARYTPSRRRPCRAVANYRRRLNYNSRRNYNKCFVVRAPLARVGAASKRVTWSRSRVLTSWDRRTDGRTNEHQTDALRLPLDAASVTVRILYSRR